MQKLFSCLKLSAWNQTVHVHMRTAAVIDSVKSETLYDRAVVISFETTNSGAGMVHKEPADNIVLVAQSVRMIIVRDKQQARVFDAARR